MDEIFKNILRRDNNYEALTHLDMYNNEHFKKLKINLVDKSYIDEDFKNSIDDNWRILLRKNPGMHNNPKVGVDKNSFRIDNGVLNFDVYQSNFKNMMGTSREFTSERSIYLLGCKSIYSFILKDHFHILLGQRRNRNVEIKGKIQAIPAGFVELDDLDKTSPLEETIRREYIEEIEDDGYLDAVKLKTIEDSFSNYQKKLLGFSWIRDYGCVDADFFLINKDESWIYNNNYIEQNKNWNIIRKKKGFFKEHELVFAVPYNKIEEFIFEFKDDISVASKYLLLRSSENRLIL